LIDQYFLHEEIYKMNFTKTMFALAIGSVGIMGAMSAHAAASGGAAAGTFDWGAAAVGTASDSADGNGSWFSMLASDTDEDLIPDTNVYTMMRGVGTTGVGFDTAGGTLNFGVVNGMTTPAPGAMTYDGSIDKTWSFFGGPGIHFTDQVLEVSITGNTGTVDMSGWTVYWNGGTIDMGVGALATLDNFDGIWNNGNDTLDYAAVVPSGSFTGVQYNLHLRGSMAPVPEASTYGMMLAGLGLVGFAVRRRKQSI
jgi:hypothetical protein